VRRIRLYEIALAIANAAAAARPPIVSALVRACFETQLSHEPTSPAKHRKLLMNLIPPWDAVPPVWELRVGEFRMFYDVSKTERTVHVLAIRKKPSGKRTEVIF